MIVLGFILLFGLNTKDLIGDIVSGDAKNFDQEITQIRNTLKKVESKNQDIVLNKQYQSPFISSGLGYLVTKDKNYWVNTCVASYYELKSIEMK